MKTLEKIEAPTSLSIKDHSGLFLLCQAAACQVQILQFTFTVCIITVSQNTVIQFFFSFVGVLSLMCWQKNASTDSQKLQSSFVHAFSVPAGMFLKS